MECGSAPFRALQAGPASRVTVSESVKLRQRGHGVSAAHRLHDIFVSVRFCRGRASLCARAYLPGCVSEPEPPLP